MVTRDPPASGSLLMTGGSTGFDRIPAAGEAIRGRYSLKPKLNLNADDSYALAAA